jgi:hypothetical protein
MKLIGFSEIIESAGDESEATDNILKVLEKEKVKFVFNTSTRPNKNGEYKTFFQESDVNDDDDEEEEEEDEEEEERKPAKKSRPAPKSKNEKSVPFKVGDKVKTTGNFFEDGNEYQGIVNEIDEDEENCAIFFEEDDDQQDIPWGNLAIIAEKKSRGKAKKEAEDDIPFEVGDTVRTTGDYFEDGVIYEGTVQEMDDENAKVEFEDETCEVPLENLELAN